MWPQIILIIIWGLSLGLSIEKHGKPVGNTNAWISLISISLTGSILWWGGFWDPLFK